MSRANCEEKSSIKIEKKDEKERRYNTRNKGVKTINYADVDSSEDESDDEDPKYYIKDNWKKYLKDKKFHTEGYFQYLILLVLLKPLLKDNDGNVIEAELCIVFKCGYTAKTLYERFSKILYDYNGVWIFPIKIFDTDNANLFTDEEKNHFECKDFKLNIGKRKIDTSYSFPKEYFAVNHNVVKIFNKEFENLGYKKYYENPFYNKKCDFLDIFEDYYDIILEAYNLDYPNLLLLEDTTNNLNANETKKVRKYGFPFPKEDKEIKEIENDNYQDKKHKNYVFSKKNNKK